MKYNNQIIKNMIHKISKGDSKLSLVLLRLFFMENFLKRISFSRYKDNFILKGGMLVSQELGINSRVTKDIDTTLKFYKLDKKSINEIFLELIDLKIDDGITYSINDIENIMDEHKYPGIRVSLVGSINNTIQPFQIDISTNDSITPKEITYEYNLLFDDIKINILSYNIETLLAEKIETILDRNITNTRMRDFYDVYMIYKLKYTSIDFKILRKAFEATMKNRNTLYIITKANELIDLIKDENYLFNNWNNYKNNNLYVGDIDFLDTIIVLQKILKEIGVLK